MTWAARRGWRRSKRSSDDSDQNAIPNQFCRRRQRLAGVLSAQSRPVLSCTIDKAMYIAVHPYFHDKIRIKYSRTEDVASASEVEHPLVRECLSLVGIERGMEIASFADVPAGTGMGSSSAF